MSESVRSVMFAGRGLLRWPGGEDTAYYRVTVALDSSISGIHVGLPVPKILTRPGGIFLHMPEGRRLALNVAPNGYLSPDGPIERSFDGQDWWVDSTPWLPLETTGRFMLALKAGPVQIFESHTNQEEAEAAYRAWPNVESAEIRPPFAKPMRLK